MAIDEKLKMRLTRTLLGYNSRQYAQKLGVCHTTVCSWENGRYLPGHGTREKIAELCRQEGIAFSPSGYPFPMEEMMFKGEK